LKSIAYYDGQTGAPEDLRVPFLERSHWFGDGVYDAAFSSNGVIFALDAHVDRFFSSMALVGIEPAWSKDEVKELLRSLDKQVDARLHFVYWQATRGVAPRGHAFPEGAKPCLWCFINEMTRDIEDYPRIGVITQEDVRFLMCNAKTLNLLPNVLAAEKAKQAGCYEAVLHRGERVTECSHSNVHILSGGAVVTAPTDNYILPGITRAVLIRNCKRIGVPVREEPFTLGQMMAADEVFLTSTASFVAHVETVDGKPVGGKAPELLQKIRQAMLEEYRAECGIQ